MTKETHVEEAAQGEFGTPDPAMYGPTRARQALRSPATAHLDDPNPVAFFSEAQGRDTTAEARANYDEIKIQLVRRLHNRCFPTALKPDPGLVLLLVNSEAALKGLTSAN
jgi:hypothetical protein